MSRLLIGREYPDEIIKIVDSAKVSIKILMYDWRWYSHQPGARIQKLNNAIIRAVNRGVEVKAILNNKSILKILNANGVKAISTNTCRTMHAKMVIVDEKDLLLGSHNFSINGFEINHEMSLHLQDPFIVSRCLTFFNNLCLS